MEAQAKHGFLGGDVERHEVDPFCESWQHRKTSNERTMNVGSHPGLPDWWKKRHKAIKGRKAGLTNRRVLEKNHRGVCVCLFKGRKSGRKNIPALKAVMLDDRKEGEGGGLPPAGLEGRVTQFRSVPDEMRGLGSGLVPAGGEDRPSLEWNRGVEGLPEAVVRGL